MKTKTLLSSLALGAYLFVGCGNREVQHAEPKYTPCKEFLGFEEKARENNIDEKVIGAAAEYDIVAHGLYDRLHGTNVMREGALEKWYELYLDKSFKLSQYNSTNNPADLNLFLLNIYEHVKSLGIKTNTAILDLRKPKKNFSAITNI